MAAEKAVLVNREGHALEMAGRRGRGRASPGPAAGWKVDLGQVWRLCPPEILQGTHRGNRLCEHKKALQF